MLMYGRPRNGGLDTEADLNKLDQNSGKSLEW